MSEKASWFEVDKEGLKEMFANFPPERMVLELVQNAWDENSTICAVDIQQDPAKKVTIVNVVDDNPEGFQDLRHAYTLFGSTEKRSDPTKRGRFNFGEKIVFARAKSGEIRTTKGTIYFGKNGRESRRDKRGKGSEIYVEFPMWKAKELEKALDVLKKVYPPEGIRYSVNETDIAYTKPLKVIQTTLATEFVTQVEGQAVMTKTSRKTEIWVYPKRHEKAYLLEMGLPVCEIEGKFDANVQQKVPLSQDRTLVPESYLQDIYAELLVHLGDLIEKDDLGAGHVRMAMEDDRVDPKTCSRLFKQQFGDDAVIQNPFDADSNQEAARSGAPIVSPRTFGAVVNDKLREGGVKTTTESFSRDIPTLATLGMPTGYKPLEDAEHRKPLTDYVKFLSKQCYGREVKVTYAQWLSNGAAAIYEKGQGVTFNVMAVTKDMMAKPVTRCTALVLHELAHCMGNGHDGVYDTEFERLVNKHTQLMLTQPELYKQYEEVGK